MTNILNTNAKHVLPKRYNNYDLLRCICLLGVFCAHTQRNNAFHQCLACFAKMSVPCFFMMSGALTLGTDRIIEYKSWIKKTCHKLVIPYAWALLFYLLEGIGFQLLHTGQIDFSIEIHSLADFGYPTRGWHLWFMYAFIEVYLLVPLLITLKKKNQTIFYMTGIILFIRPFLFETDLPWYLNFINYLALYILGDLVRSYWSHLDKITGYILAGVFSLLLALQAYNIYMDFFNGYKIALVESAGSMRIMRIASVLCMIIFSNLKVPFSTYTLTRYFFPIYLLHIFVGDVWSGILRILHYDTISSWWIIFVDCFAIFIGCYTLCSLGHLFQKKLRSAGSY